MRKISLLFLFITFLSCDKKETKDLSTKINQKDVLDVKSDSTEKKTLSTDWQDDLIVDYVKNSKKDLIKIHFKGNDKLQWFLDRTEQNDSTQFYIYNIGVDVADDDGKSLRFSSCGWVYLDSVKRKLYEYDLPNDTIVAWKK